MLCLLFIGILQGIPSARGLWLLFTYIWDVPPICLVDQPCLPKSHLPKQNGDEGRTSEIKVNPYLRSARLIQHPEYAGIIKFVSKKVNARPHCNGQLCWRIHILLCTMTLSLAELKTGVKSRRMYFQSVGGITNMFWLYIRSVSELPAVNLVRKNCRSWKCSWSRTEMNPL